MPHPISNPPNPWASAHVEWLGEPPPAELEIYEEEARSILAENDSPDIGFRWSLNPYRGCYHGCAYCYARPSHQYLGFGAGTDFERKIVVKTNAPELLRKTFERPSWQGEFIAFSGNTDCYQPLEAAYQLTRRCLAVCLEYKNPIGIITKGPLVRRDIDLLGELGQKTRVHVTISIPFAEDEMGRRIEPFVSKSSERFAALEALSRAGISTGINIAPLIPGLNDSDIPELLERAHAAGARHAGLVPLRLAAEVLPVFEERIAQALPPERVRKVQHGIREMRGGKMNESAFGSRMDGQGPRWTMIRTLFETHVRRLGLNEDPRGTGAPATFRRPSRQRDLFERQDDQEPSVALSERVVPMGWKSGTRRGER